MCTLKMSILGRRAFPIYRKYFFLENAILYNLHMGKELWEPYHTSTVDDWAYIIVYHINCCRLLSNPTPPRSASYLSLSPLTFSLALTQTFSPKSFFLRLIILIDSYIYTYIETGLRFYLFRKVNAISFFVSLLLCYWPIEFGASATGIYAFLGFNDFRCGRACI